MAEPKPETMAADKPSDPPPWYKSLTPEDQIAYWKARDDYNKAAADYQAAVDKAKADKQRTFDVHTAAKEAWRVADKAVTGAVKAANTNLDALAATAREYEAGSVTDAASAKTQGDELQRLLDAYKQALALLVAARGEAEAKRQILSAASQPFGDDPGNAEIKTSTKLQAEAQYKIDVAKADIPREAAKDLFAVKETELQARIPKERRGALVSSVQAD